MSYMSYCRFEGTLHEMRICFSDVEEHIEGCAEYRVSEDEIGWFERMVHEMFEFLEDNGIVENGEINEETLEQICKDMRLPESEY